jgi:AcrR family transcriptional regulator
MVERVVRTAIKRTSRPRDRKAQILAVASDLFYRHGYHNVSTAQIAHDVGITAGALYRHFASKQDLLAQTLTSAFDQAGSFLSEEAPATVEEMVHRLAMTAGGRRELGVLWNREARHLDNEHVASLRRRFFGFVEQFTQQLQVTRPELSASDAELLAWCALGVLTSPSYHSTPMDPPETTRLIGRLALEVCTTPLPRRPEPDEAAHDEAGNLPRTRRESILIASSRLFDIHGYQSTSMDDIGSAVGVTNAAVYKYFDSKSDLLSAVITRASGPLQLGLTRALDAATTPADGLSNALEAYIDFALVHHHLVGILVSEVMNLPAKQCRDVRRDQYDYVVEWIRLLQAARPELDENRARFVVQAVITMVNDAARTSSVRRRASLADDLHLIGTRLLALDA